MKLLGPLRIDPPVQETPTAPAFKVFLCGPSVGKSTLVHRICHPNEPLPSSIAKTTKFALNTWMEGPPGLSVHVWDTEASLGRLSHSSHLFYNSGIVMLIYQLGDPQSLESAIEMLFATKKGVSIARRTQIYLVGTCADLQPTNHGEDSHVEDSIDKIIAWSEGIEAEFRANNDNHPASIGVFQGRQSIRTFQVSGLDNTGISALLSAMKEDMLRTDYPHTTQIDQHVDVDFEEGHQGKKEPRCQCTIV